MLDQVPQATNKLRLERERVNESGVGLGPFFEGVDEVADAREAVDGARRRRLQRRRQQRLSHLRRLQRLDRLPKQKFRRLKYVNLLSEITFAVVINVIN